MPHYFKCLVQCLLLGMNYYVKIRVLILLEVRTIKIIIGDYNWF